MNKLEKLKQQKVELEQQLSKIEYEIGQLSPEIELAEFMHEKLCRHNHTDGCEWFYESWENPSYARKEYLQKAKKAMEYAAPDLIKHIIEAIA